MMELSLYLLGAPRVKLDEDEIEVKPRKALALLIYLAVTAKRHSRDVLATLLWPHSDQRNARQALSNRLSELKRTLEGDWLEIDREIVGLKDGYWLDVTQFQQRLADNETTDAPSLLTTVGYYRDDFLAGFTLPDCPDFDEWQFFQTEGLRQQLALALEKLIRIQSRQGNYEAAIPYARRWLALDPLHEPAHRHLMQLYAWAGRWATALRQYETCLQLLEMELEVPPTPETTQLYQDIKAKRLSWPATFVDSNEPIRQPAAPARPQIAHNLPAQATPFIGRGAELTTLDHLLADPIVRLVTIVGPGGIGKTRLALAYAEQQLETERFANGIYFVSLAPLHSADHIIPTMAETLGIQLETDDRTRSPKQQVLDYLRQKQMLVMMDNFEHLLNGVDIVADILQAAPGVKILATSRERLHLREEQVYPIQGLEFPDWETVLSDGKVLPGGKLEDAAEYTAVKLFMQSAQRVQPSFDPAADDVTSLTRICRLVEGMPLGIELAASWVDTLSLADIAVEIQQSLDFLETEVRNVAKRHRSIRAVFDTSWQRLSETEQTLMAQFSIFRGGFTRHAAQKITGESLRSLSTLTSKSLLQYSKAGNRYQIHELLRQYSAEKLAERPADEVAVRDRHSAYYCKTLQQREAALRSAEQLTALTKIQAEIENVRAAWDWAVAQGQMAQLEQALESLGQFYEWYGRYQEGEAAFRAALNVVDETTEPRLRVKVLNWLATFCYWLLQIEEARMLRDRSLALLDSPPLNEQDTRAERAAILLGLGELAGFGSIDSQAIQAKIQLYEQSQALYEALQDRWGMAKVMIALVKGGREFRDVDTVEQWWQQLAEVDRLGRQCVTLCREIGNQAGLANVLVNLTRNLLFLRPLDEARANAETAVDLCHTLGLKDALLRAALDRGLILMFQGNYAQAQVANQAADELALELGNFLYISEIRRIEGFIALGEKRYDEAQQNLQTSLIGFQEAGNQFHRDITLSFLGMAEFHLGNVDAARQHLIEALRLTTDLYSHVFLAQSALYLAALHLAHRGAVKRAIEIYSLTSHLWLSGVPRFYDDIVGQHIDATASSLPAAEIAAAQERGRTLDLWATAKAVLAELEERMR